MKIDNPKPFDNYTCYKIWHKKQGRWYVCLIENNPFKSRTTITYAKFLMSIKEGRILSKKEEVDHIDEDKSNDSVNNLQILTKKENSNKSSSKRLKRVTELTCPYCGILFVIENRNLPFRKNPCCSRSCATKYQFAKNAPVAQLDRATDF